MPTVLVPLNETAFAQLAGEHAITDVVMISHGQTGISRVIADDVAADLIERLSLPIVAIPSLAESAQEPNGRTSDETAAVPEEAHA